MNKETKRFLNMHKRLETAIMDYNMICPGDHVAVGLSGGKDSLVLLKLLARKKIDTTNDFKLSSVFVRMGFKGDDEKIQYLKEFSESLSVPFYVVDKNILETFKREKKRPCYLCSRDRRLAIFDLCDSINANVVAFGHHRDDFIETLMLNIFYSNCIQSMKPNNPFFQGKYRIIRPMVYIGESQIIAEKELSGIKTFSAGCPFECNSERKFVKEMLEKIYKRHPNAKKSVFKSLFSSNPEYLLVPPSRKSML